MFKTKSKLEILYDRIHFWFFRNFVKHGVEKVGEGEENSSIAEAFTKIKCGGYIIIK